MDSFPETSGSTLPAPISRHIVGPPCLRHYGDYNLWPGSHFSRIQFTPDLLPSDTTGTETYLGEAAGGRFLFQPRPILGNLILADQINRAPAKAQAALLEAMEVH